MAFENLLPICVYGKTAPSSSWVQRLIQSLPNISISVCLLGKCAQDGQATQSWKLFPAIAQNGNFQTAITACAKLLPGEHFVLLRSDTELPDFWYERIVQVFDDTTLLAASPLDNLETACCLFSASQEIHATVHTIDALCFAYSRRSLIDCAQISPLLSAWNGQLLREIDLENLSLALNSSLLSNKRFALLDHLYVATSSLDLDNKSIHSATTSAGAQAPVFLRELGEKITFSLLSKAISYKKNFFYGLDQKTVILHILHSWGGGAERFVRDFSSADEHCHHLVLIARGHHSRKHCGETLELYRGDLSEPPLRQVVLPQPIADTSIHNFTYTQFITQIQRDFCVDILMISSLIGHSLDALRTGLPTFIITHDLYPLWPVLHRDFGDTTLAFDNAQLVHDLAEVKQHFEFGNAAPAYWQTIRNAYTKASLEAKAVLIAPSHSALNNLLRLEPAFQSLITHVISHGLAPWLSDISLPLPAPALRQRLRILVPGRIRQGKGAELLKRILAEIRKYADIYLIGCGAEGHQFFGEPNVSIVLNYQREELPKLIATVAPDLALLLPTVAETFSYMLSELWSLGLPVIATRIGSLAERIEHDVTGWLVEPNPTAVASQIMQITQSKEKLIQLRKQIEVLRQKSLSEMTGEYRAIFPLKTKKTSRYPLAKITTDQLEVENLNNKLLNARECISQLKSENEIQLKELVKRADWATRHEREARERTKWAKELEEELNQTRSLFVETQTELENRTQWALRLNQEFGLLEVKKIELEEQNLNLSFSLENSCRQLNETQALNQQLLMSRSWRITAPLRRAGTLYRHFRARAKFIFSRCHSAVKRIRGSLVRRGLIATLQRGMSELKSPSADKLPLSISLPHPNAQPDLPLALPTSPNPRVSIIIPVYNKFSYTYACLSSIAEHAGNIPFEVIVIDDDSSDETSQKLPEITGIVPIRNDKNLGFIGSCNVGASKAKGEFICFLNNDTVVTSNWIEQLIDCIEQVPDAGLVGAKLIYPDGRLQEAGGIIFNDGSGWNYGRFDDPQHPKYNYRREVDYCSGAAILLRRELFEHLGSFDKRYMPAYYEDTDLAFAVRAAGLKVIYEPTALIVHFEGVTSGTDVSTGTKKYQVINQQKFLDKWKTSLSEQPVPEIPIEIAREHRARGKILIIDAYTPTPDQDSGSLRMINFMRILRNLGYAVSFMPENISYVSKYTMMLQAIGVEALYHPFIEPVKWLRENGKYLNSIILSRHYVAANFLGLCKLYAPQAKLIFDTVDLHYLREQRAAELENRDALKRQAAATRANELKIMRECDITLVVSPVEQALLKREIPHVRVEILSNVHEIHGCRKNFSDRSDIVFIGGFQHTPNVDAMLFFSSEIWPSLTKILPEIKLHIVGSKATDEIFALNNNNNIIVHGFVEDIAPLMDNCRISIAPLRYGAGVKGKVNMAMSYGLPVIATSIAVEGMYVQPDEEVLVADTPQDFASAIIRLYQDELLWNKLSRNGMENVRKFFSFEAAKEAVQHILN